MEQYHTDIQVILPSDYEERLARIHKENYTKKRSSKVRIYTPAEIKVIAKSYLKVPLIVWLLERRWGWLINSKGCDTR